MSAEGCDHAWKFVAPINSLTSGEVLKHLRPERYKKSYAFLLAPVLEKWFAVAKAAYFAEQTALVKEGISTTSENGKERLTRAWLTNAHCNNPTVLRCKNCAVHILKACGSSDESACIPCEKRYRIRVRTIAREPLLIAKPGSVFFITLTAPGKRRHCLTHTYSSPDKAGGYKQRPSVRCDFTENDGHLQGVERHEECPCSSGDKLLDSREKIAAWNVTAIARFNDFLTDLRRSVPGFESVEYFKAVEPQERGAIHLHLLLVVRRGFVVTPAHRALLLKYAIAHGFGHEVDVERLAANARDNDALVRAARYVAKYVSKTNADSKKSVILPTERTTVETLNLETGEVTTTSEASVYGEVAKLLPAHHQNIRRKSYIYRSWSVSRGWGLTLARVIQVQQAFLFSPESAERLQDEFLNPLKEWQEDPPQD